MQNADWRKSLAKKFFLTSNDANTKNGLTIPLKDGENWQSGKMSGYALWLTVSRIIFRLNAKKSIVVSR